MNKKKNKKKLLILISVLILLIVGAIVLICTLSRDKNSYTLSVNLKGGENKFLVLMDFQSDGFNKLDTIRLDSHGKGKANESLKEPSLLLLQGEVGDDYLMICPSKGEKISIEGDFYDLAMSCKVSGSKDSEALRELIEHKKKTGLLLKSIQNQVDMADQDQLAEVIKSARETFAKLYHMEREYYSKYISEHLGSLTSLVALYSAVEGNAVFNIKKDIDLYNKVLSGLEKTLPNNKHTLSLKQEIQKYAAASTEQK